MNNHFVCINCGFEATKLYKRYSNVIKTVNCDKCHKIVDKYVEFEPIIILVDSILLSAQAYRHSIYNRDFKLFWKLSLVLLLLESFALWRERKESTHVTDFITVYEQGFYFCCIQYVVDNLLTTSLLFAISLPFKYKIIRKYDTRTFYVTLLKANTLANFSKFFLLPIILWRDNTTKYDADLHRILVKIHHLSSQILAYTIASDFNITIATFVVVPVYFLKNYLLERFACLIEGSISS